MVKRGSPLHEAHLKLAKQELEKDGAKVILLHGSCPDGIVLKEGKLIALDVIGRHWSDKKHAFNRSWTVKGKRQQYLDVLGFEDLIIREFQFPR